MNRWNSTIPHYCVARKFRGVKFLRKLIRLSFHDFIFADSGPIAIINDVNIVSQIKFSQAGTNPRKPRKPRKFYPAKLCSYSYTVIPRRASSSLYSVKA